MLAVKTANFLPSPPNCCAFFSTLTSHFHRWIVAIALLEPSQGRALYKSLIPPILVRYCYIPPPPGGKF